MAASSSSAHYLLRDVLLEDNRGEHHRAAAHTGPTGDTGHTGDTAGLDFNFAVPIGLPVGVSSESKSAIILPTVAAGRVLVHHPGDRGDRGEPYSTPLLGFYFGALWCPPCRAFSPVLSEFARRHAGDFSVVFCSADRGAAQFRRCLGEKQFLAVPFASPARQTLLEHFKVKSFPTLIVVDARTPELKVVTRWGRLAIQGEGAPGSLVRQWLAGSSGLASSKTAKLLLLPVVLTLLLWLVFWRGF